MSRQVSRGSVGEYQADEQAGVARLSWRVSAFPSENLLPILPFKIVSATFLIHNVFIFVSHTLLLPPYDLQI